MTQTLANREEDDSSDEVEDFELEVEFYQCLYIARSCALFAVLLHFGKYTLAKHRLNYYRITSVI